MLISDLSARFVNIPAGRVDREIEDALGRVRAFFDEDRCGLIEVFPEIGEAHVTHICLADGIPPIPRGGWPAEYLPRLRLVGEIFVTYTLTAVGTRRR